MRVIFEKQEYDVTSILHFTEFRIKIYKDGFIDYRPWPINNIISKLIDDNSLNYFSYIITKNIREPILIDHGSNRVTRVTEEDYDLALIDWFSEIRDMYDV